MAASSVSSLPERCRAAFTSVCQFAMRGSSSSPTDGAAQTAYPRFWKAEQAGMALRRL